VHHVVIERWSRGASALHSRDARVKLLVALGYLIALATMPRLAPVTVACFAVPVAAGIAIGRLPMAALLARAAIVLPFSATFAIFSLAAGDPSRGASLVMKSYLSAAAVLVLVGTTPLPKLLRGMESLGMPRMLTLVVQFLFRYLFVISEQAQHMRLAARCRGSAARAMRFRAAAGAVAVLFARSLGRAEGIHQAMMARGFSGETQLLDTARIGAADVLFLIAGLAAALALRVFPGAL
jgi:cobalt/nickel transport system permease protein